MRLFPRCKVAEDGRHSWVHLPAKKRILRRELNEKGWRVCEHCKIWSNRKTVRKVKKIREARKSHK